MRSGLIVAGVAIAVAFFVLFASMSAGLNEFIDDELSRPRTAYIYLETGSPTPFGPDQLGLVELVATRSQAETGVDHWVAPRVQLPVSSTAAERTIRLWGVRLLDGGDVASPPYDPGADLSWGRHLAPADDSNTSTRIPCVLGDGAQQALFPNAAEGSRISISPDTSVDPWWTSNATEYPLEGRSSTVAIPRGPVPAEVVGVLAPKQGEDLDYGVFLPLDPLSDVLGQHDRVREKWYYPEVVLVIDDASAVDVRELENELVDALPGIRGTDDYWDPEEFEAAYGGAATAIDGWLAVITAVLAVMLVAGVSDTTLVAVTERRREIATLRAVGIGRRQVRRLVLSEVTLLAAVGLALGLALGSGLALLFGHLHDTTGGGGVFVAPTSLGPLVLGGAALLALGSAVVAAAYPASRAAGSRPTEALRYE